MPSKVVPVTYGFGRRDRVDPKLAPFGVLKVGQNLRVKKDGRLGMRNGVAQLAMTTRNGTLVAYDIHEYRGRLIALGDDAGNGYPTDLFEYTGLADAAWRATDRFGQRVMLSPFRNQREVGGVPQPEGGVQLLDAAVSGVAGNGYVCLVYQGVDRGCFAVIVDQVTNQCVHMESLRSAGGAFGGAFDKVRVVSSGGGVFYIAAALSVSRGVRLARFVVGASSRFTLIAQPASDFGADIEALDLCETEGGTTAVVVAFDRGGDTSILIYDEDGAQIGSTITVAGTNAQFISVEANEAQEEINLFTVETATDGRLRTYDFDGTLLDGPTATTSGTSGYICRVPAIGSVVENHIAVAVNDANESVVIQFFDIASHTVTDDVTVQRAVCRSRLVNGQSESQPLAVVFSGLVAPDPATLLRATNALFFVTPTVAHMATRDFTRARDTSPVGLSRNGFTGQLCWVAARDSGVDTMVPVVTTVDFQSTDRLHSAPYGGLLYFAGSPPTVYDGRINTELGFAELPAVVSLTSAGGGALVAGATYEYVQHWEYVLADGSVILGPVSEPLVVTIDPGDSAAVAVVSSPHSVHMAVGDVLFGADVSSVLSRTVWDPNTGTRGSIYRRVKSTQLAAGMANYGEATTVTDLMSDAEAATQAALYTQADRGAFSGPLEHNAPRACRYITATEARLLTGGLASDCQTQISKAAFLGEAFSFSEASPFFSLASDKVLGVKRLDQARLIFTRDAVQALGGEGPDDIGGGALTPPVDIPTASGLFNSWSLLEDPQGLWFQLDDAKLFRLPRGGGSPEWLGVDVEDTLSQFSVISGTCKSRIDNAAIFACNESEFGGATARLVVHDFRTQNWFVDVLPDDPARVMAVCSYGYGYAYLSNGVVSAWVGGPADNSALFIPTVMTTQPLYPFGLGGYGQICEMLITGEYRGDCTLSTRVSFDDGQTWTTLESFDFQGLTIGETFQRKFPLPQDMTTTLVAEFSVESCALIVGENPTEGLIINQLDLLVQPEQGLRELIAAHIA